MAVQTDPSARPLAFPGGRPPTLRRGVRPHGRPTWAHLGLATLGALLIGIAGAARSAAPETPILGDLNGDGRVMVTDALQALRLSLGLEPPTEEALTLGDVAPAPGTGPRAGMPLGDGAITVLDALTIIRHSAGLPGGPWARPEEPASFARVVRDVFSVSCATSSCHNRNARRAGLSLEDPVEAYALLVGHDPDNAAARTEGLKRVTPGKPEASFLLTKLTGPNDEEGLQMPYGSDPLPADRVALVRDWIAKGAPFDADDGTLPPPSGGPSVDPKAQDVTLPVPPPDKGFQISVGPFDVPVGREVQRDCYLKAPIDEPRWVKRIDVAYNKGSHHLLIFKNDTQSVPDHVGTEFGLFLFEPWQLILGAQNEAVSQTLPPGIALPLQARQQMDFQLHYVNTGAQSTPTGRGKMVANFWYADPAEPASPPGFLFGAKLPFTLPAHQETTLSRAHIFHRDVRIFALEGHFHARGRRFRIYRWDGRTKGDVVYQSEEWDDPAYEAYDPPLEIKAGTGLLFEATYQNGTGRAIQQGPHAATEEHLFYWAWYYPGPDTVFDFGP